MSVAGQRSGGPVADFCAALRRLQMDSGLSRTALARQVSYSRSQLYAILDGEIRRPPEWGRLVEPLVRACTGDDRRAVEYWRRRHGELVEVYELGRRDLPDSGVVLSEPTRCRPAQLPADVEVFIGREHELTELDHLLRTNLMVAGVTAVVISAVSGTAGVGKTALAVHWAHRVRAEFPDGQLYVNLRGYDPDQPMSAGDVLAGFLRVLGTAAQDLPREVDERAATYRSLIDGRRILVVLDNAASVEQIRPLLPGASSCLVVVTSRDSLAGLVARHGARRLDLDLLPPADALALLRALIGSRVDAEPDAAAILAEHCARLPLALRVASELAVARPASGIAELVTELADEQRRLDLLDAGGDPRTAVRAVFSWSYQHLSADAAQAFRLIGLHPGPDFDPYGVAALIGTSHEQARSLLDLLSRAHLVQPTAASRYGMHDLLAVYAAHLATTESSAQERRSALTALFDYYLAAAAAAMDTAFPAERDRRPTVSPPAMPVPLMADSALARAWLDAERATLVAVSTHTARHGWADHTTRLAGTLFRYLESGGHVSDALAVHLHALDASRHNGDAVAEAYALTSIGVAYWQQGDYRQAADYFYQALEVCQKTGDHAGAARTLGNLGNVCWQQGSYEQAAHHYQQAQSRWRKIGDRAAEALVLTNLGLVSIQQGCYEQAEDSLLQALILFREFHHRVGEARTLIFLGVIYTQQGRYEQAEDSLLQALTLARYTGERRGEAEALDNLGTVCQRQDRYDQATEYHQQALVLFREIGGRAGEADVLTNLGTLNQRQGDYDRAAEHHQQALALARDLGERAIEAKALNGIGETCYVAGRLQKAHQAHSDALDLSTEIGEQYEQARANSGLARTYQAIGDTDQARNHRQQAQTRYQALGIPDT